MRLLALTFALAGCAASDDHGGLFGKNVTGNAAFVTVGNVWNEADGLRVAERHCAQFQKIARFNRMSSQHRATYDCVAP